MLRTVKYKPTTVQINPTPTKLDHRVDFDLKGKAGEILPMLFQELLHSEKTAL
jgi:NAD-dependent SIR2 family protein deacetylase